MATYDVKQIALPGGDIANLKDGNAIHKSNTSGFVKNDGSIDQNTYQIAQEGKGLSTNDFTNEDKALIGQTLGNNTVLTTDKTPFLTRQTLNPTGFSGYVREKLVGASYAWNQLVDKAKLGNTTTIRGITMTNNSDGTLSFTGTGDGTGQPNFTVSKDSSVSMIANHVYLLVGCPSNGSGSTYYLLDSDNQKADYGSGVLIKSNSAYTITSSLRIRFGNTYAISGTLKFRPQLTDLTLAFGSTIADYLYGLSDNGSITKLRDMGCPIDKYTPYGYGLYSVKTSGKKIVGKNLFDGTVYDNKRYSTADGSLIASNNYLASINPMYVYGSTKNFVNYPVFRTYYDSGMNFISADSTGSAVVSTPSNAYYMHISQDNVRLIPSTCIVAISETEIAFEPYSSTTYPLGNDELRGKFDLVNGEIVASGDVKESNGNINRTFNEVDLSTLSWTNDSANSRYYAALSGAKVPSNNDAIAIMVAEKYVVDSNNALYTAHGIGIALATNGNLYCYGVSASPTGKLVYEKSTPTTEQSTPFADPMSLVGATTEEYIDTRDIPCPVGAERQYMGQSEDIVEIPSSPLSDGKRKLVAETSGGKTQYYFEDDKNGAGTQVNLMTYNTSTNKYVCPSDGYISLSNAGASVGDYIIMSVYGANNNTICGLRCDTPVASMVTTQSLFVKRGMKCYVRATSSTGSFTALFTPLA